MPGFAPAPLAAPEKLARRIRPAQGCWSIGHYQMTSGTIGACVYDFLPGATVSPPEPGIGDPARFYILSNSHVLANCNQGTPGDPILQPSPLDGGVDPEAHNGVMELLLGTGPVDDRHIKRVERRTCFCGRAWSVFS